MGKNMEFHVSGIFSPVLLIVGGGELMSIEDPSLRPHGYKLLPLVTSQLVVNNSKFDVSGIFYSLLVEGSL